MTTTSITVGVGGFRDGRPARMSSISPRIRAIERMRRLGGFSRHRIRRLRSGSGVAGGSAFQSGVWARVAAMRSAGVPPEKAGRPVRDS